MLEIIVSVITSLALVWFFLLHKTKEELKDEVLPNVFGKSIARALGGYKAVRQLDDRIVVMPRGNADTNSNGDTYDWVNLQKGIRLSQKQGKKLITLNKPYYLNKTLWVDKYDKIFNYDGQYAIFTATNNDSFVFLDTEVPSDNGDANVMIQKIWNVENLKFKGTNQTGLRPGPTYGDGEGSYFKHIVGDGINWVIDLEFCLNADIYKTAAASCKNGWRVQFGERWGGTNSNSQSNNTRISKPRFYARPDSEYGIHYYGCSGGVVDEPIIEGHKVVNGIFCDGNSSTVVKDFKIINGYHFECVDGASGAALKIRLAGGKATLDGYYGQYATIVADCAATGGWLEFEFKNMAYAVPKNGKLFRNNNCTWEGEYSTYQSGAIKNSNFASLVEGTPVSECGGDSCGGNRFKIIETPR